MGLIKFIAVFAASCAFAPTEHDELTIIPDFDDITTITDFDGQSVISGIPPSAYQQIKPINVHIDALFSDKETVLKIVNYDTGYRIEVKKWGEARAFSIEDFRDMNIEDYVKLITIVGIFNARTDLGEQLFSGINNRACLQATPDDIKNALSKFSKNESIIKTMINKDLEHRRVDFYIHLDNIPGRGSRKTTIIISLGLQKFDLVIECPHQSDPEKLQTILDQCMGDMRLEWTLVQGLEPIGLFIKRFSSKPHPLLPWLTRSSHESLKNVLDTIGDKFGKKLRDQLQEFKF